MLLPPLLLFTLFTAATDTGPDWRTIRPGGDTGCAFDAPFEFHVREADAARVLVFLQGGGACWDGRTCDPDAPTLRMDAAIDAVDDLQRVDGIFDPASATNPFREWTAIFVPYCTGDMHLGARDARYVRAEGDTFTVRHRGFANVRAVLEHLAARTPAPRRVVIAGASAGAVASPIAAAEVARLLPSAQVGQIADGAAGLRSARTRALLAVWGADRVLDDLGMPVPDTGDAFTALYRSAAAKQPRIRFAQLATSRDAVVAGGLRLVGEDADAVGRKVEETHAELRSAGLCYSGYTVDDTVHTLLWRRDFLTRRIHGEPLATRVARDVLRGDCTDAESNPADTAHVGAFLFAYTPRPGMAAQFERGYGRHLEWHAAQRDSLTWLAWTVVTGAAPGTFVDGVFGVRFAAMDDRVAPRDDAADADINVSPFADPVLRAVFRLRPELGPSRALEQGEPAPFQLVVDVTLRPGTEDTLADALSSVRDSDVAVYERVAGGTRPGFLLIAQFADWSSLPAAEDAIARMLEDAGDAIERVASDVWARRADLIYRPRAGGGDAPR